MPRKIVIRHLTRDKANKADPQTPTAMGELEATTMGRVLRTDYGVTVLDRVVSSPQLRGVRTAALMLKGLAGWETQPALPAINTDTGLDDFSSDPRFAPLKGALKSAKGNACVESEQALFLAGGAAEEFRQTKLAEAIAVIDGITTDGDVLVGGIHGCTIDGLYAHYARQLDEKSPSGMDAFGRQIGKCEGFILSYSADGKIESIAKVERPTWLNAVAALIGGGGD